MGFVQLKYRMRHAIKPVFYAIIVIFLIGGAFSFTSYQRSRGPQYTGKRNVPKVVAEINGQKIARQDLDAFVWRVGRQMYHVPVEARRAILTRFLEDRIRATLMDQAERKEGIRVSRKEIEAKRTELVEAFLAPQVEERRTLLQKLEREGITLEQYRRRIAQEMYGDDALLRADVAQRKLEEKIMNQVKVTDQELRESFIQVRVRHILIAPKDLRSAEDEKLDTERDQLEGKLKAAREAGKKPDESIQKRLDAIAVEKEALEGKDWDAIALEKARKLLEQVRGGADFAKLAKENSNCPSSEQGGELPPFGRDSAMAPEFEQAALELKVGQTSDLVKTEFGYHIIKLEERIDNLPDDFEEDKESHRQDYIEDRKWRAWGNYQKELRDSAQIVVHDPELLAYRMLDEDEDEEKAMQLLERAIEQDPENPGAMYELGKLWREKGNNEQALSLFLDAEKVETADKSAELMFSLGELLQDMDRKTEAVEYYKKASDNAAAVTFGNDRIHTRLQAAFKDLGRDDLAKQESDWLERYRKAQEGRGMPLGGTFTVE